MLADYSKVDPPGPQYESVNFGAGTNPGEANCCAQIILQERQGRHRFEELGPGLSYLTLTV